MYLQRTLTSIDLAANTNAASGQRTQRQPERELEQLLDPAH
ncbi:MULTISPECIES: hypothetical protein [unclassified Leifsonia]|nr:MULTISPECIES: hypothetical protein [unclassified Leifsonia]